MQTCQNGCNNHAKTFQYQIINSPNIFMLEIFNFSIKLAYIWTDNTYQNELKPIKQKLFKYRYQLDPYQFSNIIRSIGTIKT